MKIEQLIVQHLYAQKKVTLQGIGTITLDPGIVLPTEADKDADLPPGAIRFEYDLRAGEDEALIEHIVKQTRKIRPLAASDLESYSMLARQFINIGKPLSIEGIGTISKTQDGQYVFTQGHYAAPRLDETPRDLKEKTEEHISFESEAPKAEGSRKFLLVAAILLLLTMSGLAVYYFLYLNPSSPPAAAPATEPAPAVPDSTLVADTLVNQVAADSLRPAADSLVKVPDSSGFRVIIKTYPSAAAADKQYKKLLEWGHKVTLDSTDATHHRLWIPFKRPLTDTTKVRDSLQRFFGGQPVILVP